MRSRVNGVPLLVLMVAVAVAASTSASQDLYRGKTLRIVVGSSAGGGLDVEARLLSRHLGRHLAGAPRVVVDDVPGAGGLIAVNLVSGGRPDGLSLLYTTNTPIIAQLLGDDAARVDARKLAYVGSPYADRTVCVAATASGVRSLDEWVASRRPLKFGATGLESSTNVFPLVLAATLGVPVRVISGYKGTADVRLAMAGGELDGGCLGWGGVKAGWPGGAGISVIVQGGASPHSELPDVPVAVQRVTDAGARALLGAPMEAMAATTRFYTFPPGVAREVVEQLRRAFLDAMRDPAYVAEARASGLSIEPISGDELIRLVERLLTLPADLVKRLKQALGR